MDNFLDNYYEHKGYCSDWEEVRRVICDSKGFHVFNNWIKQLEFIRVESHRVILKARSDFFKAEVTERYSELLLELWQKENADILGVDIRTAQAIFDYHR